jgi:type I restriction enzyme S subunit
MYGSGVPILRIDDYQQFWSRSASEAQCVEAPAADRETYSLSENDLLVNRVNSPTHLGKVLLVEPRHLPSIFESNMMRLRFSQPHVAKYLRDFLRSTAGTRRLTANAKWAVNQASINQQDVQAVPVALPPLAEQEEVVSGIEQQISVIRAIEQQIESDLLRSTRLRKSILKRAFEGRLAPQDPTDEPADRLLERIQHEHTKMNGSVTSQTRRGRASKHRADGEKHGAAS